MATRNEARSGQAKNRYLAARLESAVYIRAEGLANMKNTPLLKEFLDQQLADDATKVFIDLSACKGMDSTFMGTLVGYSAQFSEVKGTLAVLNPSMQNRKLLDMLGVSAVLPVIGDHPVPDLKFFSLNGDEAVSTLARAEMMKEAHVQLSKLSEANKEKFAAFLQVLDNDMQKLKPS